MITRVLLALTLMTTMVSTLAGSDDFRGQCSNCSDSIHLCAFFHSIAVNKQAIQENSDTPRGPLQKAAPGSSRSQCLCRRTRKGFGPSWAIQDLQVYAPSPSCDRMEIVVNLKNAIQYCLDPKVKRIQEIIQKLLNSRGSEPTV